MTWLGIIASIVGPGGILVALIEKTRRENNRDHARNAEILHRIDKKIDRLDDRVDNHITWHLENGK